MHIVLQATLHVRCVFRLCFLPIFTCFKAILVYYIKYPVFAYMQAVQYMTLYMTMYLKLFYVFVSGNIFISRKSAVSVEEFEDEEDGPSTNVIYKIGMHAHCSIYMLYTILLKWNNNI